MSRAADADAPRGQGSIVVRGARTHNLTGIDLDIPRDRLVVITGPSGSGKSSLAFDTLFAEGQRRYVESLSVAARQALAQLPKPDADLIEGLSPTVAIDQSARTLNPRSTVGTITEVDAYLRLLFARVGEVFSVRGERMVRHSIQDMVEGILALEPGTRLSILAPVVVAEPGDHAGTLDELRRKGFVRVAIDGEVCDLGEPQSLEPTQRHSIEVYVDRLKLKDGIRGRVADSVEIAARLADGVVQVVTTTGETLRFSERFSDGDHDVSFPELTPALLSFNSPQGACPTCGGLGAEHSPELGRVLVDPTADLREAIGIWSLRSATTLRKRALALIEQAGLEPATPWRSLDADLQVALLEGTGPGHVGKAFEGVLPWLRRRRDEGQSGEEATEDSRADIEAFFVDRACVACAGSGLRPEAARVRVAGVSIAELAALPIERLRTWVDALRLDGTAADIAEVVLEQVRRRLRFLDTLGLGYLTLSRRGRTLSGGEAQRIRLATQVGAALVGITYILDEPSIGLHPRDNARLVEALERLRDLGNTVIVVEHDEDTMRAADWIVDMGPGAGTLGGRVVATGTHAELAAHPDSATGAYLSGREQVPRWPRRKAKGHLVVRGARGHNLKNVTVAFPLGVMTCVTGVSGSGKSSLVVDTLLPEVAHQLHRAHKRGLDHDGLDGLASLDKVIHVDQSPIGRSGRSNPATYTGLLTDLRSVFAQLPDARMRGFKASRFSFNVKGGRCEACRGEDIRRISMDFLPDLFAQCETCKGRRFNAETLAVTLRGKNIAEILAMSVEEAFDFLVAHPSMRAKLEVLRDVGLGYVPLGQSAITLSGGEAQRIKLAKELARRATGSTLFVLDEPTTGLHFGDVKLLIGVLRRLVDDGNTVVVIEHNLDVAICSDHLIDLGPDGGDGGGVVLSEGTPEAVAKAGTGPTSGFLQAALARRGA